MKKELIMQIPPELYDLSTKDEYYETESRKTYWRCT